MNNTLTPDREYDGSYTLDPETRGVWITVRNVVVHIYITPDDKGLLAELLPQGYEADYPADMAFCSFDEMDIYIKELEDRDNGTVT